MDRKLKILVFNVLFLSKQNEEHLLQKLNSLTNVEIRALLSRYFDKVVSLRDEERKLHLRCSEMEVNKCVCVLFLMGV